jgi:hypothetical protein
LIQYTVRESAKARSVRLVFYPGRGLVVVVPRRFDWSNIPAIIEARRDWILRTAEEMEQRRMELLQTASLPEEIRLEFAGEDWTVEYLASGTKPRVPGAEIGGTPGRVRAAEAAGCQLRLSGDVDNEEACREALKRWLTRKGRELLVPAANELAVENGFYIGKISVRLQRSRWASCSHDRSLSLNAKLLFLAPDLVEHVFLHEFCHTMRGDHSPAFWKLLGRTDPRCAENRRAMKKATSAVPGWLAAGEFMQDL